MSFFKNDSSKRRTNKLIQKFCIKGYKVGGLLTMEELIAEGYTKDGIRNSCLGKCINHRGASFKYEGDGHARHHSDIFKDRRKGRRDPIKQIEREKRGKSIIAGVPYKTIIQKIVEQYYTWDQLATDMEIKGCKMSLPTIKKIFNYDSVGPRVTAKLVKYYNIICEG